MSLNSSAASAPSGFKAPGAPGRVVRSALGVEALLAVVLAVVTFVAASGDQLFRFPTVVSGSTQPAPFSFFPEPLRAGIWIGWLVSLVSGVSWLIWQHRAQANVWVVGGDPAPTIKPGWAVGWWFVPFANLFMPFKAVRELSQHSAAMRGERPEASSVTLGTWWTLWLATLLVGVAGVLSLSGLVSSRMALGVLAGVEEVVVSMDEMRTAVQVLGLSFVLRAGAAMLAIVVVGDIERDQSAAAGFDRTPARPDVEPVVQDP